MCFQNTYLTEATAERYRKERNEAEKNLETMDNEYGGISVAFMAVAEMYGFAIEQINIVEKLVPEREFGEGGVCELEDWAPAEANKSYDWQTHHDCILSLRKSMTSQVVQERVKHIFMLEKTDTIHRAFIVASNKVEADGEPSSSE